MPMVGVFDICFPQTMPKKAYLYGLPIKAYTDYKIRRYGFHGTSHSFVSKRVAEFLGKPLEDLKTIVCPPWQPVQVSVQLTAASL